MELNQIWACEPLALEDYFEACLQQEAVSIPEGFSFEKPESIMQIGQSKATIAIVGILSPAGPSVLQKFLGIKGTAYKDIISAIKAAASDESVDEIVLNIDSPGGLMRGLDSVWTAIKASGKKVTAYNHGLMASAAYYLASAADKIIAVSPAVRTGSIGVLVNGLDTSVAQVKSGCIQRTITSTNAPRKNLDMSTEEGRAEIQKEVDAAERLFFERISQGRKVTTEEIKTNYGQGSVLIASDPDESKTDALSAGMVDAVLNGLTTEKEQTMELTEMLKDPGVQAQINAAKQEGMAEGRAEEQKRVALAGKIAAGEYPQAIRDMAAKVLEGQENADVLKGAVTAFEAMKQMQGLEGAKEETKKIGTTATTEGAVEITDQKDPEMLSEEDMLAALEEA